MEECRRYNGADDQNKNKKYLSKSDCINFIDRPIKGLAHNLRRVPSLRGIPKLTRSVHLLTATYLLTAHRRPVQLTHLHPRIGDLIRDTGQLSDWGEKNSARLC